MPTALFYARTQSKGDFFWWKMAYRQFSTGTWQDPWFERLSTKAKLLFIYLWTNDVCNQAGLYQISCRRIDFEIGFKPDEIFNEIKPKIIWFENNEIAWVKNFFRWQCQNPKFAFAAIRCLSNIPKHIVDQFTQYNLETLEKYGIDTVSIPYQYHVESETMGIQSENMGIYKNRTEQNRTEQNTSRAIGFEEFWKTYPKRVGKQEALKAWIKQNGKRPAIENIVSKIEMLKKTDQWMKDQGKYIPHPATWLNRGGWDDECKIEITATQNKPTVKFNDPNDPEERKKYGWDILDGATKQR